MKPKFEHFMDEADIGSGEKTPAELADEKETEHLRQQQEQARQQTRPMDGGLLWQVTEEQQYIAQKESHTPPEDEESGKTGVNAPAAPSPDLPQDAKKSRRSQSRQDTTGPDRAG